MIETPQYALCWRTVHTSKVMRIVKSDGLEDLALVHASLSTQLMVMSSLQLWIFDRSQGLYREIPFPDNWQDVLRRAKYGETNYIKCPVCGSVKPTRTTITGTCGACHAHSGIAPVMEPFNPEEKDEEKH